MTYRTILVGIDFDRLSTTALAAAADLSLRVGASRIHLVHVAETPLAWTMTPMGMTSEAIERAWDAARAYSNRRLAALEKPATPATITLETRMGSPAAQLSSAASAVEADLIVLATHHRGVVARAVMGSVANALVRASPCPVLVVGEDRPTVKNTGTVMAAIDLSPISGRVLEHAGVLAKSAAASVRVVSVDVVRDTIARLPPEAFEAMTTSDAILKFDEHYRAEVNVLASTIRAADLKVEVELHMNGLPKDVILESAKKSVPDLIVIGASGHNAWQRFFLGSTATHVVHNAPCPVLVVPPLPKADR